MRNPLMQLAGAAGLAAAALIAAPVLAQPAAAADDRIFSQPYQMQTLDNGLRVIVVPTDSPGVVSLHIPVQTGSRNEVEDGKSGFAHFFEHMMFRGTAAFPPEAYQAVVQQAGGDQNAYTSSDLTNYHTTFAAEDLEKIIQIEADRFQNLAYTEEQFRTEALAVKGEYLKNYANPMLKGLEVLSGLAYSVHPYGHTTMGYLEDIEEMPNQMDYAQVFFDRWYRPEYTSIIVVGDVEPAATLALVERYWGDWQRGSYQAQIPVEPPLDGPKYEHLEWDAPTPPILIHTWRGPALTTDSPDTTALMLLAEIHFGQTSPLYQQLVVRDRMADQFFVQPPTNKDPGLFAIVARLTDAGHAQAVTGAIQDTLVRARTETVDEGALANTKSRMKYSFAATMDSAGALAATLARFVHYERTPETLNNLYRTFDATTAQDILDAANTVFIDSNRASVSIATAGELPGANAFGSIDQAVAAVVAERPAPVDIPVLALESSSPLVEVSLLFDAGAAYDPPGKAGLAALTAAMISQGGTARRSYEELQQAFYPLASGLQAQVDKRMLRLSGSIHRDNLDAWYALVREMLLEPGFREDDFQRLKQLQINAVRVNLRANNDEELAKEVLYETVYGADHPYGRLNAGHAGELEAITLEDVRDHFANAFTAQRVRVGLSGVTGEAFQQQLVADLNRLGHGQAPALDITAPAPAAQRQAIVIEKETPGVAVSFGWPIDVRRGHPDWPALWLLRSYLGEHRNSSALLYQRIREQRGMNYGNYAYIEYFPNGMFLTSPEPNYARDNDLFQIWLRPLRDNNDALFATRAALFELQRLRDDGIPEERFQASRDFLMKATAINTASGRARLGYALDSQWFDIPPFLDYVRSGLAALTLEQVNDVIARYLDPANAQFVFVSRQAGELADALAGDTPSPIQYNTDKPAELLAEDALIAELPLALEREHIRVIDVETVFE